MRLTRRGLLLLSAASATAACDAPPRSVHAPAGAAPSAGSSAWSIPVATPGAWATPPVTRYEAGLRAAVGRYLRTTPENPRHPLYPGAVVFTAVDGRVAAHLALGDAVRYAADKTELPAAERVGPLLKPSTVEQLRTDQNTRFGAAAAHGLGFDIDQGWYMGRLAGRGAFGHTGFTGTPMVLDPHRRAVLVVLTNRVHPDASRGSANPARKAAANALVS